MVAVCCSTAPRLAGRSVDQGALVGAAGGDLLYLVIRASLEGPGSGGIRSGWDESAKREANTRSCRSCVWPINHPEMTACDQ